MHADSNTGRKTPPRWRLQCFLCVLVLDAVLSLALLAPTSGEIETWENVTRHNYSLHGTLWDLSLLAVPRIAFALLALGMAYFDPPAAAEPVRHNNGDLKTDEEMENEALEEPLGDTLRRILLRYSVLSELSVILTTILVAIKCSARLNVEIGIYEEAQPEHPLFWIALALTSAVSLLQGIFVDSISALASELGRQRLTAETEEESLSAPLLNTTNEAAQTTISPTPLPPPSSAKSNARFSDLLQVCAPDKYLIAVAFVFLIVSAIAQVYVPKFTGAILDSLVDHMSNSTAPSVFVEGSQESIVKIPGFVRNIELLVSASLIGGIFGGLRSAIFTMVGAHINARLRIRLMDSLLSQEIGFFDTTRTGDISSRLSSDTTLVGMSVTTCVNMFLRSAVMVVGYLIFMATISWQLSVLSFVTIPAVTVLSKWYGRYLRRLSRLQQKKLAEGSSVTESTLSSMPTVRAFGAEAAELAEFEQCMTSFLSLNFRSAAATFGFQTCLRALPEMVKALVLFYGGLLVQSKGRGHISGGDLISFVLYLSALSNAFNSLGGIYAMLVRAVGAADKVFELMKRTPQLNLPSPEHTNQNRVDEALNARDPVLGVNATKVISHRLRGMHPSSCRGEIVFRNVQFRYPARPERVILDCFDLTIPAGSVCALVGPSGSGKSSIVRLLQKLYDPQSGDVSIDGIPVRELSADWLCQNVAVVQQEPVLFARSIEKNIKYGMEGSVSEPSREEVEAAARLANAAFFIENLPQGYDTVDFLFCSVIARRSDIRLVQ